MPIPNGEILKGLQKTSEKKEQEVFEETSKPKFENEKLLEKKPNTRNSIIQPKQHRKNARKHKKSRRTL